MKNKKNIIFTVGIVLLLLGILYVILSNKSKKENNKEDDFIIDLSTDENDTDDNRTDEVSQETPTTQAENIDYYMMVDDECGFSISQFLEFKEASYRNQDEYEVKFIVKRDCEDELEKELSLRYTDDLLQDSYLFIDNSTMEKEIESGNIKHIFSFFREGKVMDASGFHALSVQIRICIVEIDGRQYAFIYA